jgi:hypothetical protein
MLTPSAVVGSSAIRSFCSQTVRSRLPPLAHAARKLMRILGEAPPRRGDPSADPDFRDLPWRERVYPRAAAGARAATIFARLIALMLTGSQTQNAAGALRLQLVAAETRNADDLAPAFRTIAKAAPNALAILNAPLMRLQVARIAELALGLELPSIYTDITFPQAGGLLSYGPNFDSLARARSNLCRPDFQWRKSR